MVGETSAEFDSFVFIDYLVRRLPIVQPWKTFPPIGIVVVRLISLLLVVLYKSVEVSAGSRSRIVQIQNAKIS